MSMVQGATRLLSGKTLGMAVAGFALLCAGLARFAAPQDLAVVTAIATAKDPQSTEQQMDSAPGAPPEAQLAQAEPAPGVSAAVHAEAAPMPALSAAQKLESAPAKVRDSARATTTSDQLADEADILLRAEAELHAGRANAALKLLNEHERRFARGLLAEERTAATVQALCALGRKAEATARLSRLSAASLQSERARRACGLPRSTDLAAGSVADGSRKVR
jgi:hypothetical protein